MTKLYGVYKECWGDSSDTRYVAIFSSEEDAEKAVQILRTLDEKYQGLFAYVDGWEFRCHWRHEPVPMPVTLAEFGAMVDSTIREYRDDMAE